MIAKIADIKRTVCRVCCVDLIDLESHRRPHEVTVPRHIAMYLCKKMTKLSLPVIGRYFDGRDHTTVLYAVRKIERRIATDIRVRQLVKECTEAVTLVQVLPGMFPWR